ncbi:uncharacterized protein LOC113494911 [Trichoplusia ni]|uniref:Uncharacterized protein LOC113494911 n=1 Tax=Trichoplusia ni TaxID=7111 RepID=A0A7E5VLS6_TRINI|nr:uncharacterized protein LOC113494911 [Trichoplusia ni]
MRTSHPQYTIMVEFMEKHGDLSKPSGGPRGRHYVQLKWKELSDMLNSDGTGDSRTEEKWRKVDVEEEESLSGTHPQETNTKTISEVNVDDIPIKLTPVADDTWNTPGTSSQRSIAPPPPPAHPLPPSIASIDTHWKPPKKKKKADDEILKVFKECEGTARQYERERDRVAEELERERIRQRDVELQLQAKWLDFFKEALKVLDAYLANKSV